jgi:hypothetical protein
MKVTWKRGLVFICALAVVIAAGVYSSDHFLKATDGEENYVESDTSSAELVEGSLDDLELPEEEEHVVAIEQGVFENETPETQEIADGETAEETTEAVEETAEEELTEEEAAEEEAVEEEAVEETTEAAEETTGEATKEETADKSVVIAYEILGDNVGVGTQIKLTAVPSGYENPVYQWQCNDGSGWTDISGATSEVYTLTVTEDNASYRWRADVEEK